MANRHHNGRRRHAQAISALLAICLFAPSSAQVARLPPPNPVKAWLPSGPSQNAPTETLSAVLPLAHPMEIYPPGNLIPTVQPQHDPTFWTPSISPPITYQPVQEYHSNVSGYSQQGASIQSPIESSFADTGPGLLGKRYASVEFAFGKLGYSDRKLDGYRVEWNTPLWRDWTNRMGVDLLMSFNSVTPEGYSGNFESAVIGTRLYANNETFRPYVELGLAIGKNRIYDRYWGWRGITESAGRVELGFEWQMTNKLATRASLGFSSGQSFDDSTFEAEAIFRPWMNSRVFLRSSASTSLSSGGVVGTVGAGIQF